MKTKRERTEKKIEFREATLDKLYDAYEALVTGGVKAYMIDDRQLTRLDIDKLAQEIRTLEEELDELEGELNSGKRRRAVGIVPRDW